MPEVLSTVSHKEIRCFLKRVKTKIGLTKLTMLRRSYLVSIFFLESYIRIINDTTTYNNEYLTITIKTVFEENNELNYF